MQDVKECIKILTNIFKSLGYYKIEVSGNGKGLHDSIYVILLDPSTDLEYEFLIDIYGEVIYTKRNIDHSKAEKIPSGNLNDPDGIKNKLKPYII